MELNIWTLILVSFGIGYLISMIKDHSKNKKIRMTVNKYIGIIKKTLVVDKNGLSAMEYNDRYTITFNIKEFNTIGMVRLLKGEKKLIVLDHILQLTDKEYDNLLETLKPVL
jgi:hypothetical protein